MRRSNPTIIAAASPRTARLGTWLAGAALVVGGLLVVAGQSAHAREQAYAIPAPALDEPSHASSTTETAVFAGGCFWGVQGVFQHVRGVRQAVSGYAGGAAATAHYGMVGTGATGHAESVQISYDPSVVSYGQLLQIYFSVAHDPTQLNRQGPDTGTQYRSTIFAENAQQQKIAAAYIAQLDKSGVYPAPLSTTIEPLKGFYPAEGYHQNYLTLHPDSMYIVINDLPKVRNLQKLFASRYVAEPVLVR